ncbi:tetratricopeptide repeat protein [Methanospirillum hungatei]|uniref:tetratricopeptide repeat protein n=1 Tax=Methanospirillum hungatei TaxID=2203 RepID=UPI0026F1D59B|nr:tetratricopeptide repeat protein [Methanospirillum hungatei]MCA1917141.1 tetratricopeptide repeat protein [Methanospirillum hungatei]
MPGLHTSLMKAIVLVWCGLLLVIIPSALCDNTSSPESIDKGLFTGVLNTLNTGYSGSGGTADDLLAEGERLLLNGSFSDATRAFDKVLETDPDSSSGWLGLARAQSGAGEQEQALISLDEFLFRHPDAWQGYLLQGTILTSLQKYQDAVASYKKALELNSTDALAWAGYGAALYGTGSYEDARDACQQSLSLRPDLPSAHYWEGKSLYMLGDETGALSSLNQTVSIDPGFIEAYLAISDLYARSGKGDDALVVISTGLDRNPSSFLLWKEKGRLLEDLNRRSEAHYAYEQALSLNPDDSDVRQRMTNISLGSEL